MRMTPGIVTILLCLGALARVNADPGEEESVPHFEPLGNRWDIVPPDYEINEKGSTLNPYTQHPLKGDYPIIGDDVFLSLTFTERLIADGYRVPTREPGATLADRLGRGERIWLRSFAIGQLDLFKGQQSFKPVDWRLNAAVVYGQSYAKAEERGVVDADPDEGRDRYTDYVALQQAFGEVHLLDLSDRYDFLSAQAGILPFRSDFRGFVLDDTNLGARLYGSAEENRWQYNLVLLDQLEKETNSQLNRFQDREQLTVVANVYRQDLFWEGYTVSASFHYNHDRPSSHDDRNGFQVRPAPVGSGREHRVETFYIGIAGEGALGPVNISHAFYQVLGRDGDQPLAGREVDVNAQFAALEVSKDFDWLRPRVFGEFASGDDDASDGSATGFDSILDQPNFAGGAASFWNRQALPLGGVNLTNRLSPLVDLETSNIEGQQNFVNPGLILVGGALDLDITPRASATIGASYLRFVETGALESLLGIEDIDEEIGVELFGVFQWRPLLTNNIIVNVGFSPFFPGDGFKDIYSSETLFSSFTDVMLTW